MECGSGDVELHSYVSPFGVPNHLTGEPFFSMQIHTQQSRSFYMTTRTAVVFGCTPL